jgi:hypothetical protein
MVTSCWSTRIPEIERFSEKNVDKIKINFSCQIKSFPKKSWKPMLLNWTYSSVRKPERIISQKVDIKNYNIPFVKLLHCDSFTLNYCTTTLSKRVCRCCISTSYSQSHNLRRVPFNWPRIFQEHRNKAHTNRSNMFQSVIVFVRLMISQALRDDTARPSHAVNADVTSQTYSLNFKCS